MLASKPVLVSANRSDNGKFSENTHNDNLVTHFINIHLLNATEVAYLTLRFRMEEFIE